MTKIWNFVGTGWFTALMLVYCVGWWIVGDFTAFWAFLTGFWVSVALNQLMDWHFDRKSSKLPTRTGSTTLGDCRTIQQEPTATQFFRKQHTGE